MKLFRKFNYVANLISRWFSKRLGYSHFVKRKKVWCLCSRPASAAIERSSWKTSDGERRERRHPVFIEPIFRHPRQMTSAGSIQPSTGQVLVKCRTMLDRRFYASRSFWKFEPQWCLQWLFLMIIAFFFVTWTNSTKACRNLFHRDRKGFYNLTFLMQDKKKIQRLIKYFWTYFFEMWDIH